ncbi:MAG TPA: arylesterase [Longimicrobiales bacterium]|nr:arylesterase [Longimicrobiales bacterium]
MRAKIAVLALFAMIGCTEAPESSQNDAAVDSAKVQDTRRVVLFLGTSLTAGYGVGTEHSFPAVVQQLIDSVGYPYRVINAGLSGETSAGGLRRLSWSLQQPMDVFILELGANDGLRGLSIDTMQANLDTILTRVHERFPDATLIVAGMESPPNLGAEYTTSFRTVYTGLAEKHGAVLIPFLLKDVAAKAELNQEDGIHPNVEGHKLVARNVWAQLEPVLKRRVSR